MKSSQVVFLFFFCAGVCNAFRIYVRLEGLSEDPSRESQNSQTSSDSIKVAFIIYRSSCARREKTFTKWASRYHCRRRSEPDSFEVKCLGSWTPAPTSWKKIRLDPVQLLIWFLDFFKFFFVIPSSSGVSGGVGIFRLPVLKIVDFFSEASLSDYKRYRAIESEHVKGLADRGRHRRDVYRRGERMMVEFYWRIKRLMETRRAPCEPIRGAADGVSGAGHATPWEDRGEPPRRRSRKLHRVR